MQQSSRTSFNRPSVILLILLTALVGYQTFAYRPAPQLAPAIIATVNLQQVYDGLKQMAAADDALNKMNTALHDEAAGKEKALKQMSDDLKDHQPGSPAYKELEEKTVLAAEEYRGYMDFCKAKIDMDQGRSIRTIYLDIKAAALKLATSEGYDMVLVDDSQADFPVVGKDEAGRQVSARRMLYVAKRIDISAALITEMNNAFGAGGAAANANAGASPAASATTTGKTP